MANNVFCAKFNANVGVSFDDMKCWPKGNVMRLIVVVENPQMKDFSIIWGYD